MSVMLECVLRARGRLRRHRSGRGGESGADEFTWAVRSYAPAEDDDLLEIGPRRRPSRWLSLAVVIVLAAAVGTQIALRRHTAHHPAAASVTAPAPASHTTSVPLPGSSPAPLDIAAVGPRVWALQGGALTLIDELHIRHTIRLTGGELQDVGSTAGLFVDSASNGIWVIGEHARSGRMIEFDSETLARIRDIRWSQPVNNAAVLDGHLLLATDAGVADLAPDARVPRLVSGLLGAIGPIAVDRRRDRLIILDLGYPTTVWTYRPGTNPVQSSFNLPFANGTVQVASGAIWVGGFGGSGAVLDRLDSAA